MKRKRRGGIQGEDVFLGIAASSVSVKFYFVIHISLFQIVNHALRQPALKVLGYSACFFSLH